MNDWQELDKTELGYLALADDALSAIEKAVRAGEWPTYDTIRAWNSRAACAFNPGADHLRTARELAAAARVIIILQDEVKNGWRRRVADSVTGEIGGISERARLASNRAHYRLRWARNLPRRAASWITGRP